MKIQAVFLSRQRRSEQDGSKTAGCPHFLGKPYMRKYCFMTTFLLYINGGVGLLALSEKLELFY